MWYRKSVARAAAKAVLGAGAALFAVAPSVLMAQTAPAVNFSPAAQMAAKSAPLACDDGLKLAFRPDGSTKILLVKLFRSGDVMELPGHKPNDPAANPQNADISADTAPYEICVVKLVVGPGNPGLAGAPSTSDGIHIEIWLPAAAAWNNRILVNGSGGWSGIASFASMTELSLGGRLAVGGPGWVMASSDDGHSSIPTNPSDPILVDGSFAFSPDGTINKTGMNDFAHRGLHETALKTKALVELYYGRPANRSYYWGGSNGGRMGLKSAQMHPEDFDGILSADPAFNWSRLATNSLYPQIVFQRDLNGMLPTHAQLKLVSASAVSACDTDGNGMHAGYVTDHAACRYDPTKDKSVLCASEGGINQTSACVTLPIARAVNKIWFGMTEDGSAPAPAISNGYGDRLDTAHRQLWFGVPRGSNLADKPGTAYADSNADGTPKPFVIGGFQVALALQNPRLATRTLKNAQSNGADGWMAFGYADLAYAARRGLELQPELGGVDSNDPDLRRFRDLNRKLIVTLGTADTAIPSAGMLRYYRLVSEVMNLPVSQVQQFFRLYPVAGHGHLNVSVGLEGVSPQIEPPNVKTGVMLQKLVAWVEQDIAPDDIVISNGKGMTRPLCLYPARLTYQRGDRDKAESYDCR